MSRYSLENLRNKFIERLPEIVGAALVWYMILEKKEAWEIKKEVQQNFGTKFSELMRKAKAKVAQNSETFIYHGSEHTDETVLNAMEIGLRAGLGSFDLMLAQIIVHWHDWQVGDKPNTPAHKRDEVVSARALRDKIYEIFELDSLDTGSLEKRTWDKLIKKMQVALIATSVNKKLAIPEEIPGLGGKSKIVQFDIAQNAPDLKAVATALDYEGDDNLVEMIRKSPDSVLAKVICAADLGYFAETDEAVLWEMIIRYGLEIKVLSSGSDVQKIKTYLKGQIVYLSRYKFPQIKGAKSLEKQKVVNVEKIRALLVQFENDEVGLKAWFDAQLQRLGLRCI